MKQKRRQYESRAISTDARYGASGGKRKGKRLQRNRRTAQVESIAPERLQTLADEHGTIDVEVKGKGRKRYATLVVYVDLSRVVPRD